MLTALARLAFDARAAGRELGAELDFGNPLCETGGFLCEVGDDSEVDVSGALKVGVTIARPELVVNATVFEVDALQEIVVRRSRRFIHDRGRIAVLVFPGTNSEEETLRLLRDCGGDAELVHWSRAQTFGAFDAYVLPGGFAYEDRIRAGAVAAHDEAMDVVIAAARSGKLVLGICNGAQILLEAGLVPGTGAARRPTAAFTGNAPVPHFVCRHVYLRLAVAPERCAITASLPPAALIPAYAAHGEGRLAASGEHLAEIVAGDHLAFVYAERRAAPKTPPFPTGRPSAVRGW